MNDKKDKEDLSFLRIAKSPRMGFEPVLATLGAQENTQLFISYARTDAEIALTLATDLRAAGVAIWIDLDIAAGKRWDRAVEQALENCPRFLVILSPASVSS